MAFSTALYYPWIDIKDERWLRTAVLYWDSVRTIVPESIERPYSNRTARTLQDHDFLIPLRVNSSMQEIEEIAEDAISFLKTTAGAEFLLGGRGKRRQKIHSEKTSERLRHLASIHPEKLPWEIRHQIQRSIRSTQSGSWIDVDAGFADYYMTLLATRLSERVGAGLLTPLDSANNLAVSVRMGSPLQDAIPTLGWGRDWRRREFDAMPQRREINPTLSEGLLGHLAIERISIDPNTSIKKLLEFKEKHKDELSNFRANVGKLTSSINSKVPLDALRQKTLDIYGNEVSPALSNLKKALKGKGIRYFNDGLMKIAFLSAAPSSLLISLGLSVPTALIAGVGISYVVSKTIYNEEKSESLRNNPYSYLLSMEKELKR